jgi:hypothetical protein
MMLWINALVRASKPPKKLMTLVPIKSEEGIALKMPLPLPLPTIKTKPDNQQMSKKNLVENNFKIGKEVAMKQPSFKMPAAKFTPSIATRLLKE